MIIDYIYIILISKEINRAEHEYIKMHPPPPSPPINALYPVYKP